MRAITLDMEPSKYLQKCYSYNVFMLYNIQHFRPHSSSVRAVPYGAIPASFPPGEARLRAQDHIEAVGTHPTQR